MSYEIRREKHVHGESWGRQASGYFSDGRMAKDYVAAVVRVAREHPPAAIVDLGGGTGFICEQLVLAGVAGDVRLISMDESEAQLAQCTHPRITPMKGAFQSFRRADIVGEGERMMPISRSVLQYAGVFGQKPWLDHVRSQMKPGEWFVHQSGCAEDAFASSALNGLFERMGVDKWVPHREAFVPLLSQAGFDVAEDFPVFPVGMVSEELAVRYGVSPETLLFIGSWLRQTCSHRPDLFQGTPTGFVFHFPYRVFLCKAVA